MSDPTVRLQDLFKETELKASGQDKNYWTLNAPPHLEQPGLLLPTPC